MKNPTKVLTVRGEDRQELEGWLRSHTLPVRQRERAGTVKHEMLHGLLHSSVHTEAFPRCTR